MVSGQWVQLGRTGDILTYYLTASSIEHRSVFYFFPAVFFLKILVLTHRQKERLICYIVDSAGIFVM